MRRSRAPVSGTVPRSTREPTTATRWPTRRSTTSTRASATSARSSTYSSARSHADEDLGRALARWQLHDRQLAVPIARRLVRGLLRDAHELPAGAALRLDGAARVADARQPEHSPQCDEGGRDPDAEAERVHRGLLLGLHEPVGEPGLHPGGARDRERPVARD